MFLIPVETLELLEALEPVKLVLPGLQRLKFGLKRVHQRQMLHMVQVPRMRMLMLHTVTRRKKFRQRRQKSWDAMKESNAKT